MENKESVIKKIQALLRMSNDQSASENEMMMAASKAQELLGKYIKQPKRKSTKLKVKITVEQIAWHKSHERHGGLSYFLVKKVRNVYLFKGSSGRALALGLSQDQFEKLAIAKDWISIETCIKANKNFII